MATAPYYKDTAGRPSAAWTEGNSPEAEPIKGCKWPKAPYRYVLDGLWKRLELVWGRKPDCIKFDRRVNVAGSQRIALVVGGQLQQ
jgi:hypothetical protein